MTKLCTKIEFIINFIFFKKKKKKKDLTLAMQIDSIEDDKHEMSKMLSGENNKKMSSAEIFTHSATG